MTTLVSSGRRSVEAGRTTRVVSGMAWLSASELASVLVGFAVTVQLARSLHPAGFAGLELAGAVVAWLLVFVRSGVEQVVWREASRNPRLIRPLSGVLLGLKAIAATLAYGLLVALAGASGWADGPTLALMGLLLVPAALTLNVGPRSLGRFAPLACGQLARGGGLAVSTFLLVKGPEHVLRAALLFVLCEALGAAWPTAWQARRFGLPAVRFRRRASLVIVRRALLTSTTRLGRVSLYLVDLIVLGALIGGEAGAYSAARRLVFAGVTLGLVVPSVYAPILARTWCEGREPFAAAFRNASSIVLAFAAPLACVFAWSGEAWMTFLFGPSYRGGGLALAWLGARLPFLLFASLGSVALVAIRREGEAARFAALGNAAALVLLPAAIRLGGPIGAAAAMVAIEAGLALAIWLRLDREGLAPRAGRTEFAVLSGLLALLAASVAARRLPILVLAPIQAIAYGLGFASAFGGPRIVGRLRRAAP